MNEKSDALKVRWSNKYSIMLLCIGVVFAAVFAISDSYWIALVLAPTSFVSALVYRGQPLLTISNNQVISHAMGGRFQEFKIGSLEELEIRDGSLFLLGDEKKKLALASQANPEDWKRLVAELRSIKLKGEAALVTIEVDPRRLEEEQTSAPPRGLTAAPVPVAIPAGRLPDGTVCSHEGETSTYCTRCWMDLYEARQQAAMDGGWGT